MLDAEPRVLQQRGLTHQRLPLHALRSPARALLLVVPELGAVLELVELVVELVLELCRARLDRAVPANVVDSHLVRAHVPARLGRRQHVLAVALAIQRFGLRELLSRLERGQRIDARLVVLRAMHLGGDGDLAGFAELERRVALVVDLLLALLLCRVDTVGVHPPKLLETLGLVGCDLVVVRRDLLVRRPTLDLGGALERAARRDMDRDAREPIFLLHRCVKRRPLGGVGLGHRRLDQLRLVLVHALPCAQRGVRRHVPLQRGLQAPVLGWIRVIAPPRLEHRLHRSQRIGLVPLRDRGLHLLRRHALEQLEDLRRRASLAVVVTGLVLGPHVPLELRLERVAQLHRVRLHLVTGERCLELLAIRGVVQGSDHHVRGRAVAKLRELDRRHLLEALAHACGVLHGRELDLSAQRAIPIEHRDRGVLVLARHAVVEDLIEVVLLVGGLAHRGAEELDLHRVAAAQLLQDLVLVLVARIVQRLRSLDRVRPLARLLHHRVALRR